MHNWVKHTLQEIEVIPDKESSTGFRVFPRPNGSIRSVTGCDNCGLPLTPELFEEPCLSTLMDQFDVVDHSSDGEEGD